MSARYKKVYSEKGKCITKKSKNISPFFVYTLYWVIFMIFIARRKIVILSFFAILFAFWAFFISSDNTAVFSPSLTRCIIVDAGHGLPDGGAVGKRGTIESTLNIKIAKAVEKKLAAKGYTVIMTRKDDNTIADSGETIGQKKKNDMHKRLEIINSSDADIFLSIHMNKFQDERYRGAQVIYSGKFSKSQALGALIQEELWKLPDNKEKRQISKAPSSIFLLKNATIPAIIVECGFLSSFEEEELLNTEKYQNELAEAIVKGVERYYASERSK